MSIVGTMFLGWATQQIPGCKELASRDDAAQLKRQSESQYADLKKALGDIYTIDERDLRDRYPLGYELFYVHGTNVYTPYESTIPKTIEFDWPSASAQYSDSTMTIQLPNIRDVERDITTEDIRVTLSSAHGSTAELPIGGLFPFEMAVEVLGTGKETLLAVIGVKNR